MAVFYQIHRQGHPAANDPSLNVLGNAQPARIGGLKGNKKSKPAVNELTSNEIIANEVERKLREQPDAREVAAGRAALLQHFGRILVVLGDDLLEL